MLRAHPWSLNEAHIEQEENLFFRAQTDIEGCLTSVFFAMPGAHEIYAVDMDHQVVELDTKVHCLRQPQACCVACAAVLRLRQPFLTRPRVIACPLARHQQRGAENRSLGDGGQHKCHQDPRGELAYGRDGAFFSVYLRVLQGMLPHGTGGHLHGQRPRH